MQEKEIDFDSDNRFAFMRKISLTPNFSDKTDRYFAFCGFNSALRASSPKITGNSFPHVAVRNDLLFAWLTILLTSLSIDGRFVCNAAAPTCCSARSAAEKAYELLQRYVQPRHDDMCDL